MAWDVRNTYFYLVCFATLLMVILGTVQLVRSSIDLVFPSRYGPSVAEMEMRFGTRTGQPGQEPPYTREELRRMAVEEEHRSVQQARRDALRRLLGNLALVLIAAPVYLYHWRQVRHAPPI